MILLAVCEVKGKSVLKILPNFDVVKKVQVDYMHCVLLGLVRKLLSLWFDRRVQVRYGYVYLYYAHAHTHDHLLNMFLLQVHWQ